jgi:prepilin-type N-terminal cleavage/methylation domain-containing protein
MWKKIFGQLRYGQKGFTLIELLVVVAILGVLAAVAVPNIGKFIGKGKSESYATELHNIQTAVMAMLTESETKTLDNAPINTVSDLSLVFTTDSPTPLLLSNYLIPLNQAIKTGCTYDFLADGTVIQHLPGS